MGMEVTPCPKANPECPHYYTDVGCHLDEHHRVWPARRYVQPIEIAYRHLSSHADDICRHEHDTIHLEEEPPPKPTQEAMRISVARAIRIGEIVEGLTHKQKRKLLHSIPDENSNNISLTGEVSFQQS